MSHHLVKFTTPCVSRFPWTTYLLFTLGDDALTCGIYQQKPNSNPFVITRNNSRFQSFGQASLLHIRRTMSKTRLSTNIGVIRTRSPSARNLAARQTLRSKQIKSSLFIPPKPCRCGNHLALHLKSILSIYFAKRRKPGPRSEARPRCEETLHGLLAALAPTGRARVSPRSPRSRVCTTAVTSLTC